MEVKKSRKVWIILYWVMVMLISALLAQRIIGAWRAWAEPAPSPRSEPAITQHHEDDPRNSSYWRYFAPGYTVKD